SKKRFSFSKVRRFAVLDHGYGVGLAQAQALRTWALQRRNRRKACKVSDKAGKQAWYSDLCLEAELESDVFDAIVVIVHFHFVEQIGIKGEVVGPMRWFEERIHVQNHRDQVRVVVADKRVPVGNVSSTVERGNGSFAVTRREQGRRWKQHQRRQGYGYTVFQSVHGT